MNKSCRQVFYVSDRTGITVETLGHSLLSQFADLEFEGTTLPYVDSEKKLTDVIHKVNKAAAETGMRPLVFSTLVNRDHHRLLAASEGMCLDFFETLLPSLEQELGASPQRVVGRTHGVNDPVDYDARMDTVNYALGTDDGVGAQAYDAADVIVVGVSRSGKTPTCLYMALQFGIRAANYPLTEEDLEDLRLPASLTAHRERLFGLMIDPLRLQQIRSKRRPDSRYASPQQCQYEVRQLKTLLQRERIPFVDSTSMSVE